VYPCPRVRKNREFAGEISTDNKKFMVNRECMQNYISNLSETVEIDHVLKGVVGFGE